MVELHCQTDRFIIHLKIDATILWAIMQALVLAGRYLSDVVT
jgi:hypothetical protein